MKTLLALAALAAFAAPVEAGPIRDRLRARFAPRPACVPCSPAQTVPQAVTYAAPVGYAPPASVSPVAYYTLPANCPNGQCPLIRR